MAKHSVDAPDFSDELDRAGAASDEQFQLAKEQSDWGRQQDARNQEVLQQTLGIQLPGAQQLAAAGGQALSRYQDTFVPLEDQYIDEARGYDTPERRDAARGSAMADVTASFDAARQNAISRLEGYGVDPSQTRNAALDIGVRTAQAAAQAQAAQAAGIRVEDTGRGLRENAITLGQNVAGRGTQEIGAASNVASNAVQAGSQTSATGVGLRTSGQGFTQLGLGANQQAANIKAGQFGADVQSTQIENAIAQNTGKNIGSIIGMAAGGMSDGGKVGDRSAIPVGTDRTMEYADRHISDTYGASESNTPSKILPRPLPPVGQVMNQALPIRGHEPLWQAPQQRYSTGGPVDQGPSDGSGIDDQVPAKLSVGEYVIPADVVATKGKEFFDKLLQRYHTPAAQQAGMGGQR